MTAPDRDDAEHGSVTLPVARVAVDVSLSHLDRFFDYAVAPAQDAEAVPGARVRVRFAGKLRDGFIVERCAASEHEGRLATLHKVISAEPVLTSEIVRLIRRTADHYAGCFADVMRLAVPPRHAATEKATPAAHSDRPRAAPSTSAGPFRHYPTGEALLGSLRRRMSPRAAWQLTPTSAEAGDWAVGFAVAAAETLAGGRGTVAVVPDQRDLLRLQQACVEVLGERSFVVLTSDLGPAARYRAFLAVLRGDVRVVIGTRAAVFAPVRDLGLLALWDDGDDLLAEPRAPYPHAREVLAIRAAESGAAVLLAGYGRTAEVQQWVDRGWLRELKAERAAMRHSAPRVKIAGDSDFALQRDPHARETRLPHEVFELVRAALLQGPVLVQVPRAGYLVSLTCQTCRDRVRCPACSGPVRVGAASAEGQGVASCGWCGRLVTDWACPTCGEHRWRAPVVGAGRTAEELGRAFPQTPVRQSAAGRVLSTVPSGAAIVVATPGAEPTAEGGYAAALLLDTSLLLLRADLRAGEEALRRWLNVVGLVRSGADGGSVLAVGESTSRALQALVRLDPDGFAQRELAERAEARFPPAVKMIQVDGRSEALAEFLELAELPGPTEVLGPVELGPSTTGDAPVHRLTLRSPLALGQALTKAVKDVSGVRSARKSEGALRVRVDPVDIA
nr:primosomal protein N' [Microlunatus panaciterrae]